MFYDVVAKRQKRVLRVIWNKKTAVSTALLSYELVKRAGTAVNRSSSCLYTVLASGCAVLRYGRVVKMPNKFTDEKQVYVDIQSVYGFCNGNGRAAVMERRQRRPLRRISCGKRFEIVRGMTNYMGEFRTYGTMARTNAMFWQHCREEQLQVHA